MPEISRFYGIVIRMFSEPSVRHHRPHFHAYYQSESVVAVDPLEIIEGWIPDPQRRLVEAWAEIHRHELFEDWSRLLAGRPPFKIDPLR